MSVINDFKDNKSTAGTFLFTLFVVIPLFPVMVPYLIFCDRRPELKTEKEFIRDAKRAHWVERGKQLNVSRYK